MSDIQTVFVRGAGGSIFEMDVPEEGTHRRERFDQQLAAGDLAFVQDARWVDGPEGSKHLVEVLADDGEDSPKGRGRKAKSDDGEDSPKGRGRKAKSDDGE